MQSRCGHLHAQGLIRVVTADGGCLDKLLTQSQLPGALGDDLGIEAVKTPALFERLLHANYRMIAQ
jgi:hypothetical protein